MGLAATMWVPMGAQAPVLSLNHHPNPSQGRKKGFGKRRILEILQVSLNSLHSGNSIAFGKSTSQRIYSKQPTHKIGKKRHKYGHCLEGRQNIQKDSKHERGE